MGGGKKSEAKLEEENNVYERFLSLVKQIR